MGLRVALGLLLVLGACSSKGGGRQEALRRREMLRPPDPAKLAAERAKKIRFVDDEGGLIESELEVAGLTMPRGLELKIQYEDHWYFQSLLPLDKLQQYFGKRLSTAQIERGNDGSVTFRRALPRGAKTGPKLTVLVGQVANLPTHNEVRIEREPVDLRKNRPKTFPEVEAELRKRRKYAD